MSQRFVIKKPGEIVHSKENLPARKIPEWRGEDFRAIVINSADGIVILDHDGIVLYVNPAAESLFGMTSAEMTGAVFGFPIILDQPVDLYIMRGFKDFVSAEMRLVEVVWAGEPSYLLSFRDLTDRIRAQEAMIRAKEELEAKVKARTSELSGSNDLLRREIVERNRIEKSLRESEERLSLAQQAGHVGVFDWDLVTDVAIWTPELEEIFGIPHGKFESVYDAWARRVYPEDLPRIERYFEDWIRFGRENGEWEYRFIKNGEIRWISARGRIFYSPDGKPLRMVGTNLDITGRKRFEEALQKQASLIDLSPDGILVRKLDATITFWSKGAEVLYGWAKEEALGQKSHTLFKTVFPEPLEKSMQEVMQTGWWSGELIHTTRGGRQIVVQSRWQATGDRDGKAAEILESNVDITERKQAEKAVKEAKEQAELYIDLMSHDINNMNQSALGYLELAIETLELDGKIGLDDKLLIQKPLQAIASSSKLIDNVRILQQLATEGVKVKPIDLHNLFDYLKAQDYHSEEKEVTVMFEPIPHYMIQGSELLRDVFYNLISNAVKHSLPDEPVTINVKAEPVVEGGHSYYKCVVEDNGPGIPDEMKPRLFHRFQRGKTKAHGKGLGLYLVRTLVESYHGKVWVEDRVPGDYTKGARFVVMLQAAEKQ